MAVVEDTNVYKKRIKSKNREKTKNNSQAKFFLYLLICFILVLTIIYNYAIITQTNMEIDEISRDITSLTKEKEDILVLIESTKNTGIIEDNARTFLGMDYPDINQRDFIEVSYNDEPKEVALENSDQNTIDNIFRRTFSLISD